MFCLNKDIIKKNRIFLRVDGHLSLIWGNVSFGENTYHHERISENVFPSQKRSY